MKDLMELLRASDPVDPAEVRGWAHGAEGRRVFRRIVGTRAPVPPPAHRPVLRAARLGLIPAGAAAVALALVVGSMLLPDAHQGASAEAAEVLRSAAKAARVEAVGPPEGRYRYTRAEVATLTTEERDGQSFTVYFPFVREMWVAPDESGRVHEKNAEPVFLRPRDRAAWEAAGSPELWERDPWDDEFGPSELPYEDFSEYSTDPDELYEQIERKAVESSDAVPESVTQRMFVIVTDLLSETVTPPELRAALYEVAARIPDVELLGRVTDPRGRPGVAVGVTWETDSVRLELIFDDDTFSELLAVREVLVGPVGWVDAEPGTAFRWTVYLESGAVDSTSARP